MRANVRRSSPCGPADHTTKALRTTWRATYAPANSSARSPNASGMATAMSSPASMTTISTSRTATASGSNQFVIHVV